jgi:hypothetical protein
VADALAAVARGLAVFALPAGGRRPEPGWQQRSTRDPDQVRRWVTTGHNVGIGCRASGVVGFDLDHHQDGPNGVAVFAAVCARFGQAWPDTFTVTTPHHGQHLYFRVPAGRIALSTSGGRAGLGAGIDVRGPGRRSGGYLLGPGSIVAGRRYAVARDTAIAWLPDWLAVLLNRRRDVTMLVAHHVAPHQPRVDVDTGDRRDYA